MEHETLVTAAVGRIASIGDLYDARSGNFCSCSIFKKEVQNAIKEIDDPSMVIKSVVTDTFEEKFDKLNVEAELKFTILAGLFSLEGHGKYLNDAKKSKRAVRSTLLYNVKTKHEHLDIFNENVKDCLSLDAVNLDRATHVVTEVSWGANSLITMEYENMENMDRTEIEGDLKVALKTISTSINGGANVDYSTNNNIKDKKFSFTTFADVLPANEDLPQTFEEVLAFMKKMPQYVQKVNNGKGKPLQYTMVPLAMLQSYLKISFMAERSLHLLDEQSIIIFVKLFDEILFLKQELHDLFTDMTNNKFCVLIEDINEVGKAKSDLDIIEATVRSKLAKTLVAIRSGKEGAEQLEVLHEATLKALLSSNIHSFINKHLPTIEKIALANVFRKEGVSYIGNAASIDVEKLKNATGEIFILFLCKKRQLSEAENWCGNVEYFLSLIRDAKKEKIGEMENNQHLKKSFIVVDLDVHPELVVSEGVTEGLRICQYKNGKYIDFDVLLSHASNDALCMAKSNQIMQQLLYLPNKRTVLEISCPCMHALVDQKWTCINCKEFIDYGFDEFFYCACGRAPVSSYQFKCSSKCHGLDYLSHSNNILVEMLQKIRPFKELNILILGETGVGKSTFINAFANYLTYSSLIEAEQNEMINLISTSFTILNDKYIGCKIETGKDKNEKDDPGKSATQEPKAYTFDFKETLIRIIDTPGIGDTGGFEIDLQNTNKILKFISSLDEIHGICILLKPNNARLNVLFRFCIKQLLTHLHRSASENIVFCFTNARSTFYRPGDTYPALNALLSENKDIKIALSKHTMYCLDNESFRFLSINQHGKQHGITFTEEEHHNYSASWETSVKEIDRLFEHISNLKPHKIKDTLSLNDARRVIINLTFPMADISKNIHDNIRAIQRKKEDIENSELTIKELAKNLKIPAINLERKNLDFPKTVCTNAKCVTYHTNTDNTHICDYTTICHDHCHLTGIPPEHYPHEGLKNCAAMLNGSCTVCSCNYGMHTHLTYEYIRKYIEVDDQSVISSLKAKETAIEVVNKFISGLITRIEKQEEEQDIITKTSAKFGCFLKNNAISPYNDALAEYLDHQIREETDHFNITKDRSTLERLEKNKRAYEQEVSILEKAMKSGKNVKDLGAEEIKMLVEDLYALPINGKQIKQHMEQILVAETKVKDYHEVAYRPKTKKNNSLVNNSSVNYLSVPVKPKKKWWFWPY